MKWKASLLFLVLAYLMSSCQTRATPEPSFPTAVPATKPSETGMPATPAIGLTATPIPTKIVQSPEATPDIAATVIALNPPRTHSSFLSPDGKWRVEVLIHDCVKIDPSEIADPNALELLKLSRIGDATAATVDSQLQTCGGVGAYGFGGLFWSPGNRYFYYTDARESLPDGLCGYWARPIKRVDVDGRNVEFVGGGHLSPDKTRLAFWQDNEIVIWGLDEGEISRVPGITSDIFANEISWSPDSESLVYLQTELDCYPFGKSYVTRLDLSGMTQYLLLESQDPSFGGLRWDAPNRISLVDAEGKEWRYNLVKKELRPVP